ncbi:hypothetical protein J437_LFUL016114 [Ladona fulva]|uniref:Guanine nucleotide exchange factor MSS4 n=1 Tax=Ladona fulva TaxID=123851 RepID=A0A8K0P9M4_LADFU|nr:hypothetical protein J437_LFUL016114 [Ladona fulva]
MFEKAIMSENHVSSSVEDLIEDGKNAKTVHCMHCPSKILSPKNGSYQKIEFLLPEPRQKKDLGEHNEDLKEELLSDFWVVEDMYRFENMGFSHSVGSVKYLACADCEIGPIGLYRTDTKCSYVAIARVKHS